jgi:DNA-binding transcriptional ArsR family regulator
MTVAVDDDLWSAIGDPTRRRMLDLLLADGEGTATSLSEHLPVTRQAVAKHLGVLDRAGLVRVSPAGREMRYRVDEAQFARAVAQLAAVGTAWDARLRRIKRIAEAIQRTQDKTNHDKTNHDKTNHDKTNHDKTNHDKTNHDKTNHDKTNHDKTKE